MKIDLNNADISEFTEIFLSRLDKHAQKKKSLYEQITLNLVTKNLRETIMKRSKLRNKYLRERTSEAKSLYNKQKNFWGVFCVKIRENISET